MQESLFSLELVVESVENLTSFCRLPAVAFRLLDFPTLIIHHIPPQTAEKIKSKLQLDSSWQPPSLDELKDRFGNYQIHKGKSCLFRIQHEELFILLSNTPLYVMLVDVWPDKPKLVGSTSVPLNSCMGKIHQDILTRGIANPSVHGQSGRFDLYNLMGSKIGVLAMSVRLLSLGGSLIPHIPEASVMNREHDDLTQTQTARDLTEGLLRDNGSAPKNAVVSIASPRNHVAKELSHHPEKPPAVKKVTICDNHTQTDSLHNPKQPRNHPPCSREKLEEFVISNTICPPPLFYNSLAEPPKTSSKYANFSDNYSTKAFHIPSQPYLREPQETQSQAVQTHRTDPPQKREEIQMRHEENQQNFDLTNMPLLNALLRELSALTARNDAQSKVLHSIQNLQNAVKVEQPVRPEPTHTMEKAGEPENRATKPAKKQVSVLGIQNRRKQKPRQLTYGTTRAQEMRLERNRILLGKDGAKCEACVITKNTPTTKPHPVITKKGTRQRMFSAARRKRFDNVQTMVASVEVQTEGAVNEQKPVENNAAKETIPIPKRRTSQGTNQFGKTFPLDFPEVSTDLSRVFSPDESVPSQNSMDIFLPTAEEDSDGGSERDSSFKSAEDDEIRERPVNNRYGTTGITSPVQDRLAQEQKNREESPLSYHSTRSATSQRSTVSVIQKPPIAKPRTRSFDRGSPTHQDPDQPILSARSPSVSRTTRLVRQTVIEREEGGGYAPDNLAVDRTLAESSKTLKSDNLSEEPSRVSTPVLRRSSITSVDSEYRKARTTSQLSVRDYSEDFCSVGSGSDSERDAGSDDSSLGD